MVRLNVAVVLGDSQRYRIDLFEELQRWHDVTLFVLGGDKYLVTTGSNVKLRLHEPVEDMPGYIRGLEEELAAFDVVLALEATRLSSFQAVRGALRFGKPFGVIVNEHRPYFYANFPNIKAIQQDILSKSDVVMATSQMAAATLELEGVAKERIQLVRPGVNRIRFKHSETARAKFRRYIGLPDDAVVILYYENLDPSLKPEDVIHALKLLKISNTPNLEKVRLLYAGDGTHAKDLKYLASDAGIGRQTLFLHQNADPFLADMFAASDVLVVPWRQSSEFHGDIPAYTLEAMACGVIPMVARGTVAAELVGRGGISLIDDSFQSLASALRTLILDSSRLAAAKISAEKYIADSFDSIYAGQALLGVVAKLEQLIGKRGTSLADFEQVIRQSEEMIRRKSWTDVQVKVEEMLLLDVPSLKIRSELLRLRAEVYLGTGKLEQAMDAFAESAQCDPTNASAYRGLGQVAFHGHSHEEALTFFKKALSIRSDDFSSTFGMGMIYRRLGLSEEALFWLEKCIAIDASHQPAMTAFIQIARDYRHPRVAIALLERVIETIGERPALLTALGQIYVDQGLIERGRELLTRAAS